MLRGCDISYAQAVGVDISTYDFVIIRSNDGTDSDSKVHQHAQNAINAGKLIGFYLYSYPNLNTAQAEAEAMADTIKPYLGNCLVALDWEGTAVSGNYPESYILTFMETLHELTGLTPFFYTFASALSGNKFANVASQYPLWIAHWGVSQPSIGAWDTWTLWQYQGDPFDLDYFNGSREEWLYWCGETEGNWIVKNSILTQGEMRNNARLFNRYFQNRGWSLNAICGMLGNIEKESSISPGVWGYWQPWGNPEGKGYGLVQWTPYTRITNWLTQHGYELTSGNGQCAKIQEELEHPEIENTWTVTTQYPITFQEFSKSVNTPEYLAQAFLYNYEKPADYNQPDRSDKARAWYNYLTGGYEFHPRLNGNGVQYSPYWYSNNNPFYAAGFGLPNCTCYAWGRWWEITGERPVNLSLGNANTWWERSQANGVPGGQVPQLGAIICFYYSDADGGGHVAVVEQINEDGSIVTSNSAWGGSLFYMQTLYPPDYKTANGWPSYGYVQGFLYPDSMPVTPNPVIPDVKIKPHKFMFYLKPYWKYRRHS